VLLTQFRPPLNRLCLEFPAGLVDAAETPEQAAERELKEETGLRGSVARVTPIMVADPGMSNANLRVVVVDVDGDAPENLDPQQQLDEGEFIEVHRVPLGAGFCEALERMCEELGCEVDARVYSLGLGLSMAGSLSS